MCHDDALYKFTFYLLTYLLTYLLKNLPRHRLYTVSGEISTTTVFVTAYDFMKLDVTLITLWQTIAYLQTLTGWKTINRYAFRSLKIAPELRTLGQVSSS